MRDGPVAGVASPRNAEQAACARGWRPRFGDVKLSVSVASRPRQGISSCSVPQEKKLYGAISRTLGSVLLFRSVLMLLPDRQTLLQRLQDAARNGYQWYIVGHADEARWHHLQQKFANTYGTDLPKSTRSRRRRSGEAVARLYGCNPPQFQEDRRVIWVLVVTDGRGRVHDRERLANMRQDRVEIDGYELVNDGVCWSWQMSQKRFRYWRERIHEVAARQPERRRLGIDENGAYDVEIESIMDRLYRLPGFRLTRRQVGRLVTFARKEWQRLRPAAGPQIRVRAFLPYVQRLPNVRDPIGVPPV